MKKSNEIVSLRAHNTDSESSCQEKDRLIASLYELLDNSKCTHGRNIDTVVHKWWGLHTEGAYIWRDIHMEGIYTMEEQTYRKT